MSHIKTSELRETLDEIAPRLDTVLKEGPLNDYLMGREVSPAALLRRDGNCQAVSWLLRDVLIREGGIHTQPSLRTSSLLYRRHKIPVAHVVLKMSGDDPRMIDPTFEQYYRYVGLDPELARTDEAAMGLYPDSRIAIIDPDTHNFPLEFAVNADRIEHDLSVRKLAKGALVGSSLQEKINVYTQLWNPNEFRSMFAPRFEVNRAITQSLALMNRTVSPVE